MSVSSVNSTPSASLDFLNTTPVHTANQQLSQDDFLKLLTTQLSNQDPLKPMEDTQFIAQMAQFSSLQQATTMTKNFESFSNTSFAQNLLGKTVTIPSGDTTVKGPVTEVQISSGTAQIVVGGKAYDPSTVTNIVPTPTGA